MIEILINNIKYKFEKPITILQACEQAYISIPRFCYHEKLSVAGNCRMCLVEVEKSPKPIASCAMPISNGMVVYTETPLVKKAREAVLEFLLINHPLDCPICDQGGECDLQDLTLNFGTDRSRSFEFRHGVEDKECGPIVKTIMTRCIHCTRCIRFLTELAGFEVFGALGRGELMEIGTFLNKYLKTELSGNLVDLCPVGALTSKPYAFLTRNWELKKIESIDFHDGVGSNIVINVRNNVELFSKFKNYPERQEQILRILPKLNGEINENWISDKTRYAFDGNFKNRIQKIILKKNNKQISYNKWTYLTLKTFLFQFYSIKTILKPIVLLGSIISLEESFFLYQFLKIYGIPNFLIFNKNIFDLNIDHPNFYKFNTLLSNLEKSDLILLIGTNPRFESSMLNMRIRKHFFNKECVVGLFGSLNTPLTYPVLHLGISTKKMIQFCEGKHFFCTKMRAAKNPLIIFGSSLFFRNDSKLVQNLQRFLSKKNFLFLKTFIGTNILNQNLSQINFCDLGISLNAKSFLYKLQKNYYSFIFKNSRFCFFLQNFDNNFLLKNLNIFMNLNTHFIQETTFSAQSSIFNIPITSLYERDFLTSNIEGRIQKGFKAITPLVLSRNSENFYKSLVKLDFKDTKIQFTNFWLYLESPFLKHVYKDRVNFYMNILFFKEITFKIYNSPLQVTFKNFYMSNNLTQNSKLMAECNLFNNMHSNFLN